MLDIYHSKMQHIQSYISYSTEGYLLPSSNIRSVTRVSIKKFAKRNVFFQWSKSDFREYLMNKENISREREKKKRDEPHCS